MNGYNKTTIEYKTKQPQRYIVQQREMHPSFIATLRGV